MNSNSKFKNSANAENNDLHPDVSKLLFQCAFGLIAGCFIMDAG